MGLVEVDCSTSSTVFVGATSSKEGFSRGVGPAFLLFDAVFDLGGMLTDADGFSASAVFVADLRVRALHVQWCLVGFPAVSLAGQEHLQGRLLPSAGAAAAHGDHMKSQF